MKLHHFGLLALAAAVPAHGQADAPADSVYEASAVSTLPRPLNLPEFTSAMTSAYPQVLRDIGVPGTVQVRFVIGSDGAPRDFEVTASSADFLIPPAVEALSVLRFSPAELDGRPVPMYAELPVRWQAATAEAGSADTARVYEAREVDREPRPINVQSLARDLERRYPPALRDAGVQGEVVVGIRISPEGVPVAMAIIHADNPDFAEPTIAALRSLRFQPAEVGGKPVSVWVCLPVQWRMGNLTFFESPGAGHRGDSRRPVAIRPHLKNPEVLQRAMAAAHAELAGSAAPRWGRVLVQFRVGVDGVPTDVRVAQTSDRRLNAFSIGAVEKLRFDPATIDGRPVPVPMQLPLDWAPPAP